ncbi:PIN domain-containing protein [Micropruina sp.]|uniref:PIN domain-containing protein n=1 Tax=Micropruina sp. TaxID=2737536 RepID=UPI0039E3F239
MISGTARIAQAPCWLGSHEPARRDTLSTLLIAAGTGGHLITDAYIAALALEQRCPVLTFDRGIARFGVECVIPG